MKVAVISCLINVNLAEFRLHILPLSTLATFLKEFWEVVKNDQFINLSNAYQFQEQRHEHR